MITGALRAPRKKGESGGRLEGSGKSATASETPCGKKRRGKKFRKGEEGRKLTVKNLYQKGGKSGKNKNSKTDFVKDGAFGILGKRKWEAKVGEGGILVPNSFEASGGR